jgi:hypothetical protein
MQVFCYDALYLSLNPGKCSKLNYPTKGMENLPCILRY